MPTYRLPTSRLLGVLAVVIVVALLFLLLFHTPREAAGQDPTKTCDTAARTPILALPHMVAGMAHPEVCFNQAMDILDAAIPPCP